MQAVSDLVLVKLKYAEKIGRFFVPDQHKQYSGDVVGVVVSVGPACPYRGELKPGDEVLYARHEGWKVGEGFVSLKPKWVLGRVEE